MNLIMRILRRAFWIFCKIFPVKKNKIVLMANYGRGYSDNPKYIAEALIKAGADMEYVWIVKDKNTDAGTPDFFKTAVLNSFAYIYHMSTAKFWVDNARKYYCMKKRGQYYIQTWHGGLTLKKVEKDVADKLEPDYVRMAVRDASQTDLMLSGCKTMTELYRSAFWYEKGEILEKGLPRNDRLLNYTKEDADKIKEKFSLSPETKIALYAPTFRHDKSLGAYNMDYTRCLAALKRRFGGEWIMIIRLHPNIAELSEKIEFDGRQIIDGSKYSDGQELYMISDIAMTDYSTVVIDFMLTGKPCLLYASDIEEYSKDRDLFVPIKELPFALAETNDELENNIETFDLEKYEADVKRFCEKHGMCETGKASEAAAEWIINRIDS